MKKGILIVTLITFLALIVSCSSGPKPKIEKGPKKIYYPQWWDKQSTTADYVYAYGEGKKKNNILAFESAKTMAYNEATQYVENYVKSMTKDFLSESGTEDPQVLQQTERTVKMISKQKFSGTTPSKRETVEDGNKYRSFVRLSVPKEAVDKSLVNHIKNEEALYNEFKATQAFKELEKDMENYEE